MSRSLWNEDPRQMVRRELRNFFNDSSGWWNRRSTGHGRQVTGVFPPVNIYGNEEGFRVRAEMPGIDGESLDISCKRDQLVIRGERKLKDVDSEANFHRQEREGGTFRRAVNLPEAVNPDGVEARYEKGVLDVFAPLAESHTPRRIEVQQR